MGFFQACKEIKMCAVFTRMNSPIKLQQVTHLLTVIWKQQLSAYSRAIYTRKQWCLTVKCSLNVVTVKMMQVHHGALGTKRTWILYIVICCVYVCMCVYFSIKKKLYDLCELRCKATYCTMNSTIWQHLLKLDKKSWKLSSHVLLDTADLLTRP